MFGGLTFLIAEAQLQKRPPKLGPGGGTSAAAPRILPARAQAMS
jgi:hypothetical protein